jgi:hypothetical protein
MTRALILGLKEGRSMPTGAHGPRTLTLAQAERDDDPYWALIRAILHRAVEDAQGRCVHPGARSPVQIEVEARAWLADGQALADLLELVGFDAEPVLRRVQRLLSRTEPL